MDKAIKEGSRAFAKFLGWEQVPGRDTEFRVSNLFPICNIDDEENTGWVSEDVEDFLFHEDWGWLMAVYDRITSIDNGRWDVEIKKDAIIITDSRPYGKMGFEYQKTNEKNTRELLFNAMARYIKEGLFNEQ